jgi:hypothetical protein
MPWDSWAATMMANAIRDPLYQAARRTAARSTPLTAQG